VTMRLLNSRTFKLETFQNVTETPPYAILSHRWEEEEVTFDDLRERDYSVDAWELQQRFQNLERRFEALQCQLNSQPQGFQNGHMLDAARPSNSDNLQNFQKSGQDESGSGLTYPHLCRAIQKKGFLKVANCCKAAEQFGIFYIWIDTCCINQNSSSDLSESINSMFAWYRNARLCIAYLFDVAQGLNTPQTIRPTTGRLGGFNDSQWFSRGWTLQELIAPKEVWFYDKHWKLLGTRSRLASRISKITRIAEPVLQKHQLEELQSFSVSTRLSWAAGRQTTRSEDRAYSLMGLFGVNMPAIYGEGLKAAFFRLQKEIFNAFPDHSVFAWESG